MTDKLIPPEVENSLKTKEGKRYFAEITGSTGQQKYDRLESFLHPPANVVRWLLWRELLVEKYCKN